VKINPVTKLSLIPFKSSTFLCQIAILSVFRTFLPPKLAAVGLVGGRYPSVAAAGECGQCRVVSVCIAAAAAMLENR